MDNNRPELNPILKQVRGAELAYFDAWKLVNWWNESNSTTEEIVLDARNQINIRQKVNQQAGKDIKLPLFGEKKA